MNIQNWKSNTKLSNILSRMLLTTIQMLFLFIVASCALFMMYDYGFIERGDKHLIPDLVMPALYVLVIASSIASAITFILWFYRIYSNLAERSKSLKPSSVMALISWFIPLYNFYAPLMLMKKVFVEANTLLGKKDSQTGLRTGMLDGWWFLIIATLVFLVIELTFRMTSDTSSGLFKAELLGIVCELVACILSIRIVRLYNKAEEELSLI